MDRVSATVSGNRAPCDTRPVTRIMAAGASVASPGKRKTSGGRQQGRDAASRAQVTHAAGGRTQPPSASAAKPKAAAAPVTARNHISTPRPLPPRIAMNGAQLFSSHHLVGSIVEALLASLDTTMPHGLGDKIDDPVALVRGIDRYARRLEHLEPGTAYVANARATLKDAKPRRLREYVHPSRLRTAIACTERIADYYKRHEPDGLDTSIARQAQQLLRFGEAYRHGTGRALARLVRAFTDLGARAPTLASASILSEASALALSVARVLLPGILVKAAQAALEEANTALEQARDTCTRDSALTRHNKALEHLQAVTERARRAEAEERTLRPRACEVASALDQAIEALRKTQPDSPEVTLVKEIGVLLTTIHRRGLRPISDIDQYYERLKVLESAALKHPHRDDAVVTMMGDVCIVMAAQGDLQTLQEKLLAMQHRLSVLAIESMAQLSRRSARILRDNAGYTLGSRPSRGLIGISSTPVTASRSDAERWLRNNWLMELAKTTSERFAGKWKTAIQQPPALEQSFSNLLLHTTVSSTSPRLIRLLIKHAIQVNGAPEETLRRWQTAATNANFQHQEKLDFACMLYRFSAMPAPDTLVSRWDRWELRTAVLEQSLEALIQLDREGVHTLPAPHAGYLDQWRRILASQGQSLPSSLHDLLLGTLPHGSLIWVERTLATGSDQASRAALESYLANHTAVDLGDFLGTAIRQRKPESIALLLQRGALPADAESFLAPHLTILWNSTHVRAVEAGHAAMVQVIRQLVDAGAPVTCSDRLGYSMFHAAASRAGPDEQNAEPEHQLAAMQALLARGAEINRPDHRGRTALAARLEQRGDNLHLDDPVVLFLHDHGGTLQTALQQLREGTQRLEQQDPADPGMDRTRLLAQNRLLVTKLTRALDSQV